MLRFGLWVRFVLVGLLDCAVDLRRQFIAQIDSETLSFSAPGFSFNARSIAWHPPLGSLIPRSCEWLCLSVCTDADAFCRGVPLVFVLGRLGVCVGLVCAVGCWVVFGFAFPAGLVRWLPPYTWRFSVC